MRIEKLRFVGVTPGIVDHKHDIKLGKARGLFEFLVMKQTSTPVGYVNYGHAINYDWILERYPGGLPRRTCERWIARLRSKGYIATELKSNGFRIRILNPKKWSAQLRLPLVKPVPVPDIHSFPQTRGTPEVADQVRQKWRTTADPIHISVKESSKEEQTKQTALDTNAVEITADETTKLQQQFQQVKKGLALPNSGRQKTASELDARRRELLDQAELIRKKYKTAG